MQMQVNLLPKQYRPKPKLRIWPVLVTVVLIVNLVAIGSYWLWLEMNTESLEVDLASIQSNNASLERQVADAEWAAELQRSNKTKADFIGAVTDSSRLFYPLLQAIERAMEPGVSLTELVAADTGQVTLAGETRTVTGVANMLGSLQRETGLDIVRFNFAEPYKNFQITMQGWSGREGEAEDE